MKDTVDRLKQSQQMGEAVDSLPTRVGSTSLAPAARPPGRSRQRGFTLIHVIGVAAAVSVAILVFSIAALRSGGDAPRPASPPANANIAPVAKVAITPASAPPAAAALVAAAPAPSAPAPSAPAPSAPATAAPVAAAPVATAPAVAAAPVAAAPASAAAKSAAPALDDVRTVVQRWAQAWSKGDVEQYLGFYGEAFNPGQGLSRSAWEKARRQKLQSQRNISVSVKDLQVEAIAENRAVASFTQDFASDTYRESGTQKALLLTRDASGWRIIGEAIKGSEAKAAK